MEHVKVIQVVRLKKVAAWTGLSKTQIYRLMQQGKFPIPAKLSERIVGWDEAAIQNWLTKRFVLTGGQNA